MNKKLSVTIGIPALNEEANIGFLIEDILKQNEDFYKLEKILVISDGSTDKTVELINNIPDKRVTVIDEKTRMGPAIRQNQIFSQAQSDAVVLLNADIQIKDKNFLSKIISPIINQNADLVSAFIKELPASGLFESALYTSMQIKHEIFEKINGGNNIYTCHGPGRAFSKSLYKKLKFKSNVGEDAYSYLFCIKNNYKYQHNPLAIIYYQLPNNLKDHLKQSKRFAESKILFSKEFGDDFVKSAYNMPKNIVSTTAVKYFYRNPIQVVLYILTYFFIIPLLSRRQNTRSTGWDMATSSKSLGRIK